MPSRDNLLEKNLNSLADLIIQHGGHAHKNHARRTLSGITTIGEPWDYEFFGRSHLYCFDAKECSSKKLYIRSFLSKKSNSAQCARLAAVQKLSPFYVCGFAVWFRPVNSLRLFPVEFFSNPTQLFLLPDDGLPFPFQDIFNDCSNSFSGGVFHEIAK